MTSVQLSRDHGKTSSGAGPPSSLLPGSERKAAPVKPKIVVLYETLVEKGPVEIVHIMPAFWDELFLLKVNAFYWRRLFDSKSSADEMANSLRSTLHAMLEHAVDVVSGAGKDESDSLRQTMSTVARVNALETIACLFNEVVTSSRNFAFDVANALCGISNVDELMIARALHSTLSTTGDASVIDAALGVLVSILSAVENNNANMFFEYFMTEPLLEPLLKIASDDKLDRRMRFIACQLLSLLFNYNKFEARNPYPVMLHAMKGHALLGTLDAVCACLDEATVGAPSMSPLTTSNAFSFSSIVYGLTAYFSFEKEGTSAVLSDSSSSLEVALRRAVGPLLLLHELLAGNSECRRVAFLDVDKGNVVTSALRLASHVVQQSPHASTFACTRLCMLILTGALDRSELYDTITQTVCKVPLFHRKGDDSTRPLAAHILDLMTLFLTSNLRSKFPVDDYAHALTIVEQVIYALRRNQCRLPYMEWAGTYATLVTVLKYCLVHFDRLREQSTDISYILEKIIAILNSIITHGDAFLPDTISYDSCHYEILRNAQAFDKLGELVATGVSAVKVDLSNIRAICKHFLPKMDSRNGSLTPEEVLKVIRANYDTLELTVSSKLHEQRPSPLLGTQAENNFFRRITRIVIQHLRESSERCGVQRTR